MPAEPTEVRPPAVAGQFYPRSADELRMQVEDLLARAPDAAEEGQVLGLISPHAGYAYSGATAAAAYRQVRGRQFDAVIAMAPSHREVCEGASIYAGGGYETPIGVVPVDQALAEDLIRAEPTLSRSTVGHAVSPRGTAMGGLRGEHAVEVQLPFLQLALGNLALVPIVMDSRAYDTCRRLADALAKVTAGRNVLLLASSDLYHGYDDAACRETDAQTLRDIASLDPEQLQSDLADGQAQACGGGPILTLMLAAVQLGARRVEIVARTNSNDATGRQGDYVVGYGSAVVYGDVDSEQEEALSSRDRASLGAIATAALQAAATGEALPDPELSSPVLREKRGAFVTLRSRGELRGCIGDIHGQEPLGLTVHRMTEAAASRDPRFPPVEAGELPDLDVEISVLTPMRRATTPTEVEVGRHGIWIRRGTHQGVLLPQVAEEQGWNRTQFLEHTCLKAHLPATAWQDPETEIWLFSADVFPV